LRDFALDPLAKPVLIHCQDGFFVVVIGSLCNIESEQENQPDAAFWCRKHLNSALSWFSLYLGFRSMFKQTVKAVSFQQRKGYAFLARIKTSSYVTGTPLSSPYKRWYSAIIAVNNRRCPNPAPLLFPPAFAPIALTACKKLRTSG